MEPTQFDGLTKALATSTSRRQAFKIFAGSAAAVMLSVITGAALAFAACESSYDIGKKCGKSCVCIATVEGVGFCSQPCIVGALSCTHSTDCPAGACVASTSCGSQICVPTCWP